MATKIIYLLATLALALAQMENPQGGQVAADNKYGGAAPTYNPQPQQSYDFSGSSGTSYSGGQQQQTGYYYSQPSPAVSYSAPVYNPQPTYNPQSQPAVQYVAQPAPQSYSNQAPVMYSQPVQQYQQQPAQSYSYSQPMYQPMGGGSYQNQQQGYGGQQQGSAPSYGGSTGAVSSDPFSKIAQWIIPAILVVGVIIVLFSIFGGIQNLQQVSSRALGDPYFSLEETADNAYKMFLAALESEDCRQRVLCEAGLKLKGAGINGPMLTMVGKFAPEFLRKRIQLTSESEDNCEQYQCTHPYFNSTHAQKKHRRPIPKPTGSPNAL